MPALPAALRALGGGGSTTAVARALSCRAETTAIQLLHFYTLQGESVLAELARHI